MQWRITYTTAVVYLGCIGGKIKYPDVLEKVPEILFPIIFFALYFIAVCALYRLHRGNIAHKIIAEASEDALLDIAEADAKNHKRLILWAKERRIETTGINLNIKKEKLLNKLTLWDVGGKADRIFFIWEASVLLLFCLVALWVLIS